MKALTFILLFLLSLPSLGADYNLVGTSESNNSQGQPMPCEVYLVLDEVDRVTNLDITTNQRITVKGALDYIQDAMDRLPKKERFENQKIYREALDTSQRVTMEFAVTMEDFAKVLFGDEPATKEALAELKTFLQHVNQATRDQLLVRYKILKDENIYEEVKLEVTRDPGTKAITSVYLKLEESNGRLISKNQMTCENLQAKTSAALHDKTSAPLTDTIEHKAISAKQ